ncbi:MAG: neutral/alkaline non-lysosomal ceramidase N-terminal domain-containing protein [Ardenticatenaceae bacterium]|nr:neutral/alkaline non-lysosomal ceramidase N-terminal domain-containing protein [Ardenticatenaceae bacterium]
MPLQAGTARIDITPPPGQPMAGFPKFDPQLAPTDMSGYFGRQGGATGTHDPLYARALVLDNGERALAFVAVDLVMVTAAFTAAVRDAVHQAIGLRPEDLLIAASHTHAGPDLFGGEPELNQAVEPQIQRQIVAAVQDAYANRRPARAGWADVDLDRISINRRDAAGPIDPRVGVMRVEGEDEKPIALVVNFAVHTCMLSAANCEYSGDLSGFAMNALERLYPGSVALFLNGAAGNINPVAYPWGPKENVVPVFREAWHAGRPHPRTFANTARLGHILAAAAMQAAEQVQEYHDALPLAGAVHPATLPVRAADELSQVLAYTRCDPSQLPAGTRGETFETQVQALQVGPRVYVALPGEPFVELGLDLQRRLGRERAYVVGYANDDAWYVLPESAHRENRYETWGSFLAAGSGEALVDAAERVAREVAQANETAR